MSNSPELDFETGGADFLYLPETDKAQTECGVVAIYLPNVTKIADKLHLAASTVQHRGQLSAGLAVNRHLLNENYGLSAMSDLGHVSAVIEPFIDDVVDANIGQASTRYATSRNKKLPKERLRRAAMPIVKSIEGKPQHEMSLAGNFNFKFARDVATEYGYDYDEFASDGDFVAQMISDRTAVLDDVEKAATEVLTLFQDDAFCITIMTRDKLLVFQDPRGMKPLHYAELPGGGWVIASERAAQNILGAYISNEFAPGNMMVIDQNGMRQERVFEEKQRQLCVLEHVYFSRPDNVMLGNTVKQARFDAGRALAHVLPVEVDLVAGVPESGLTAAKGYSVESGIPKDEAFIKNRYAGRTFIQEVQHKRDDGVSIKLVPFPEVVNGKRLVIVEDSIVRGTTSRQAMALLKAAGAIEVHLRVASPRVTQPCFYGVDMKTKNELIANKYLTDEELAEYLGVETVAFLDVDSLLRTAGQNVGSLLCHACFGGPYPTPVPVDLIPRNE